jgi:hypothetical protein
MSFDYKKYVPHTVAIIIFAVLTLIYFKPLLSGKDLRQDDIARHKGMSKEIADYRQTHHAEPLWTNSMFGGMPGYQISPLFPGNWVSKIDNAFKLYLPHPGGYLFLYFLGFFILLLCLEVNVWLALVGAIAYGLSSYFLIIIEAGHNSKANALGYLPALLGGVILLFRGKPWLGLALTSLFTAMELNANHVQITYYGYILIGFIILGYFFKSFDKKELIGVLTKKPIRDFTKGFVLFIIATIIGLLPNYGVLSTTNEYGKYSTRGKSELSIDYNSIRSARSKAIALDGKLAVSLDSTALSKPGMVDEAAKERHQNNKTSGLDKDYATNWSYGIGETFTFLIPDFKGGASGYMRTDPSALKKVKPEYREQVANSNSYFGDQPFTSGPVYIGAIVVFLALLGMFVVKNPIKWPLFFATLLTIALGWGNNFMSLTDFFMDHIPGYNKFRAVSMIMVIAELTLPLLAILAVNELISKPNQNIRFYLGKGIGRLRIIHSLFITLLQKIFKKTEQTDTEGKPYIEVEPGKMLFIPLILVGGFCLLGYLLPDMFNTFHANGEKEQMISGSIQGGYPEEEAKSYVNELMPQIEIARKAVFKSDAIRSFIFILLAFGALFLYLKNQIKKELLFGALGLFILIDLWSVDMRYLNDKSFITKEQNRLSVAEKTATDEEILKDPAKEFRVLNIATNTFNDASTSYYHKSVGGYHGAKLKKYQELIDFHLEEEINIFRKNAGKAFGNDSSLNALLGKLNVINMLNTKYIIIPTGENKTMPLPNQQANGNAWFVKSLRFVLDADSEIVGLYYINTKAEAVLNKKYKTELRLKETYEGEGQIKLTSYEPNYLVYESDAKAQEFAVFSEIYYPKGWNAYIDGQLKPHANVDYVLRGMNIPAGKHKIEFKFEPKTYETGNTIAMIGSVLLVITVGAGIFLQKKKGTEEMQTVKS